jgi:hypothetical protein
MLSIALVAEGIDHVRPSLSEVASALQIQLMRDAGPPWNATATCTAYASRSDVPSTYALLLVVPDTQGDGGFHTAPPGQNLPPSAQVDYTSDGTWTISASHEAIEMLIDPTGGRFQEGQHPTDPGKTVQFLVEACDPCQDPSFAYQVDAQHSVLVSDFCLPAFYGIKPKGSPFTHQKSVAAPLRVARGGYLSWLEGGKQWFQLSAVSGPTTIGPIDPHDVLRNTGDANLRGALDRMHGRHGPATASARSRAAAQRKYALIRAQEERSRKARDELFEERFPKLFSKQTSRA